MSKFNTQTKTENLAGGKAYLQSPELELISILFTSFVTDQFYRGQDQTLSTIKDLIAKCDKRFVAQAAIYARVELGMRSITHVVASELGPYVGGQKWAKSFYNKIIYRPDDMTEILSYHKGKIPNAMKKGFAKAFHKFNRYQLAKYRGDGKGFKLVDVANIVHPVPCENNADALADLMTGKLKSFDTWEVELSQAGKSDDAVLAKANVWESLLNENKLGYFALLRNLRNIIEQSPQSIDAALEKLTNKEAISKSLVLPFRFTTAYAEIAKVGHQELARKTMQALNLAVDLAVSNVPVFDGSTLVVLDVSGSMSGRPAEIGALFASVLIKSNNADFMVFSDGAEYRNVNPNDSTITIANSIRFASGGTNFPAIFQKANRKYDRVIILSDMQGWIGHHTPARDFASWKQRTGADPFVYSFDLAGYGSMQFPERNVFAVAGFSEKIFDVMKLMEQDKNALIENIKQVEL